MSWLSCVSCVSCVGRNVTQVQLWKVTQVQIWKVTQVQLWKVTQVQIWKVAQVQAVNRPSVASDMRGELLSCPCCSCRVNDEDRVFYLKALRSSGPQMRGVPRPGVSETFEPNMPDVEHVPSDGETSDIPALG